MQILQPSKDSTGNSDFEEALKISGIKKKKDLIANVYTTKPKERNCKINKPNTSKVLLINNKRTLY